MDRTGVRYEVLENEQVPAEPVAMVMIEPAAPPPYAASTEDGSQTQPETVQFTTKLPNYVEATTLPTYEEAERSKLEEATHSSSPDQDVEPGHGSDVFTDLTIGTDGMFICTFLISFLFNWLGFLLSLCLSNTVAGRCGALSGLGLSIVKWVAIVKHKQWASDFADGDSWLWWLLFLCGFILFIRGSVQYVRVKYEWSQLTNRLRHYRLI
ncbi:NEDD4 family-interacting protein 1-like isoform X2 [Pomacea canaliculata]|uniref:NEDD4 family-interacting protein 1-like isoform X2 n=1 Tax=Pomacea canaliculata TaxID=400727 RepID=UPI000D72CE54|nr:NEDD4 family-interacting protein 1-like isoform X2 [Pomacea canaliculata]